MKKSCLKQLLFLFILLFFPVILYLVQHGLKIFRTYSQEKPANIIVDAKTILGPILPIWQALAQGGEEKEQRLKEAIPLIKPLSPKYIRIDHIFDFYDVVKKGENNRLIFDFSKLDLVVNDILETGAKPMLSLSYMPPAISSGDVTDPPVNWHDWQETVRKTIEHFSGKNNKNISDVYYEVWNEPDLFGKWKTYGEKNYCLLYFYAIQGANQAENVNPFKIGGPAITSFYKTWLEEFIKYVYQNNLRLDFFSWHTYSLSPQDFLEDVNSIDSLITRHGGSYLLPKLITEWGSDSERSPIHDTAFDAAHTIAVIRKLINRVNLVFSFEIEDGKPPSNQTFWGGWGILTHRTTGFLKKPRYFALMLLNHLRGEQLRLTGEGIFITGIAARENNIIRVILVNYDKNEIHTETFPITFKNLTPGTYLLKQINLEGKTQISEEKVKQDTLIKTVYMPANSVLLLELYL